MQDSHLRGYGDTVATLEEDSILRVGGIKVEPNKITGGYDVEMKDMFMCPYSKLGEVFEEFYYKHSFWWKLKQLFRKPK
jgi:hypothetical protein